MKPSVKTIIVVLFVSMLALTTGCNREPETKAVLYSKIDGLKITKEPSAESKTLYSLKKGEAVADLGKESKMFATYKYKGQTYESYWRYVEAKNGVKGWACPKLLTDIDVNVWLKEKQYPMLLKYSQYVFNDNYYGYINTDGEPVIEPEFKDAKNFSEGLGLVKKNNAYGYVNSRGKFIIDPRFSSAGSFSEGLARVNEGNKWGYIDRIGVYAIKKQFDECGDFSEGLAWVKMKDKYGYINHDGETVIEKIYTKAGDFRKGSALVEVNGRPAIIDQKGKFIIEPQIDEYDYFRDGLARVVIDSRDNHNKTYGFIDKTGKIVVQPYFDDLGYFAEGLAAARISGRYGYIDQTGKFVISPQFNGVSEFQNGLAMVDTGDGQCGLINKKGIVVKKFDFAYHNSYKFQDGLAVVCKDYNYFLVDIQGRKILDIDNCRDNNYSEGLIAAMDKDKWGYLDRSGKLIIAYQFDDASEFKGGMAVVGMGSYDERLYGIIDKSGKYLLVPKYKRIKPLQDGFFITMNHDRTCYGLLNKSLDILCEPVNRQIDICPDGFARVVSENGEIRYLDQNGQDVLKLPYADTGIFSEGLASFHAQNDDGFDTFGYLDQSGKVIFQKTLYNIEYLSNMSDGMVLALIQDKSGRSRYGYLDRTGQLVIDPKYTDAGDFSSGLAPVRNENGLYGYINKQGEDYLSAMFQDARPFSEGYAWVVFQGKWGIIGARDEWLLEPTFDCDGGEPDSDFHKGIAEFYDDQLLYITRQGKIIRPKSDEGAR